MYYVVHNMERTVMQAIQIEAFGNPAEVMKLVDIPDVGAPGEGEVVIALEASPINMSDLLMISGRYGYRPKLPCVVGTEGVGRVVAVRGPWPDESWKGWWGDTPPYHTPVFVLTHHARAPITMQGGTVFHFVT